MPRRSHFDMQFRPEAYPAVPGGEPGAATEIARFTFKYGELRQARLLACPGSDGIRYLIEKDAARPYDAAPATSARPLTFAELIDMAEVGIRPRERRLSNGGGRTTEQLVGFIDAASDIYPELNDWYLRDGRDWARAQKLSSTVSVVVQAAVAVAAVVSIARAEVFSLGQLDLLLFVFFGLSVLSLTWATDRRQSVPLVGRWLTVGAAAFLVAQGLSLAACASIIAGVALLHLLVGLGVDLSTEAFRPLRRYRFAGIGHPNWQGESCLLLIFSSAYLHAIGVLPSAAWVPLLVFAAILLVLTRSRTGFWTAIATALVWTALELTFPLRPMGILIVLTPLAVAAARIGYVCVRESGKDAAQARETPPTGWAGVFGAVAHLGRGHFTRRNFGGRTGLWRFVLSAIRERPLLGYGYWAFWTPEKRQESLRALGWDAGTSHSIYLETALNTGLLGLALFLGLLGLATVKALAMPAPDAIFVTSFIFMASFEGLFESSFASPYLYIFRSFALALLVFAIA
jgi:hypothetical protein